MGVFVQPRPSGHHMPAAPHALRMTHCTPRVKVSTDPPALLARDDGQRGAVVPILRLTTQHGPPVTTGLL
jgi:hypothetical protein